MPFHLPKSTVAFLRAGKQFDYDEAQCEAGRVGLHHLDKLTLGEVWVGTDTRSDPHHGDDGYYAIPAVSLTGECASYNPAFILLWLPQERLFGAWDCDHWVLTVFPDATWEDIVADPLTYLNSQWSAGAGGGVAFQPWPKYEFKTGRPY